MEVQARRTEKTNQTETNEVDTETTPSAPLLTPGLLYTPGRTLLRGSCCNEPQAVFDRANDGLHATLSSVVTDKAAAVKVATHAYDEPGTRGDGQRGV